jgi:hypothetical protein
LKKVDIEKEAGELVRDPESFNAYVSRQQRKRDENQNKSKREKSQPGSGKVWNKKITKPQKFNLRTEDNSKKNYNIKSCEKVF